MTGPLLALETSGSTGSVALALGGEVAARRFLLSAREHASRLLPAVSELLDEAGVGVAGLGGIVVGSGPGSFTGVRVAAASAKGMAHALAVPLWAVSSLRAAALTASVLPSGVGPWEGGGEPADGPRGVLFDARGRRLFVGLYDRTGPRARPLRPDRFATLDHVLDDAELAGVALCGNGALRHAAELTEAGRTVLDLPEGVPTADALLRSVLAGDIEPVADPSRWEPDYLRATGAERAAQSGETAAMG